MANNRFDKRFQTIRLVRIAIIAALYVGLTYAFSFMSYGGVQFRISEILVLLCFYNRDYCFALILGCIFANIGSPLGYIDLIFGVMSTVFSVVTIRYCKNIYLAAVMPVLSMVFVALELTLFLPEPSAFILNLGTTMGGEAAVMVVGVIFFKAVEKNRALMRLIDVRTKKSKLKLTDSGAEPPATIEKNIISDIANVVECEQFIDNKEINSDGINCNESESQLTTENDKESVINDDNVIRKFIDNASDKTDTSTD